ncbi:hypothetical protein AB1207_22225 [Kineococcus endophyticus]|uniref:Uncharacterized protein n=1 Tax=Kineococcus endophyticus TaxID=1181883 RepID=A0ABV3PCV9_9ACTN
MSLSQNVLGILGAVLFLAVLVFIIRSGVQVLRAPTGQRPTAVRMLSMFAVGFAGSLLVMLLSVATDVRWLSWAGFALMVVSMLLWPLSSLQQERELRAARARDKALGLPVARNLMCPGLLAVSTAVVGVGVGIAVWVIGFNVIQSRLESGALTWAEVQDYRQAVFLVGFIILAAVTMCAVPFYFVQRYRRTLENRRVDRERGELA